MLIANWNCHLVGVFHNFTYSEAIVYSSTGGKDYRKLKFEPIIKYLKRK